MISFFAFLKKEVLESYRSGKLLLLGILFVAFGVMNPAIAKLTPWLLEVLSEELADSGMQITAATVDAITSWTQFFKNIPMALIVFVLLYSGSFTKEYESGTLILLLTKGLARYKVLLAKTTLMLSLWTVGYWICFGITFGYNAYFWDNGIAVALVPAAVNWWIFGVFVILLTVLYSVLTKTYSAVLLCTSGTVLGLYLLAMLPKLTPFMPVSLMNSAGLLVGAETVGAYSKALIVTLCASAVCLGISIPVFNKKQL